MRKRGGVITEIYDKTEVNSQDVKKLFVGVFQISKPEKFKKCLEEAFQAGQQEISTFYYALRSYSKSYPLKAVKTDNWFDIGHADKYYSSSLEVKAREFNHITIDRNRGILRKTSDDKEKFIGEILWYLKLPADIEYVRPRIFSYSTHYESPYIEMEYYSYHTLHELFLYGDLTYNHWKDVFHRILLICNDFKRYTVWDEKIQSALEDMYLTKTIQRLNNLKTDPNFSENFARQMIINGIQYRSVEEICVMLESAIPELLYDIKNFHIIHGDLCFSNIMVDSNFSFIKVIDPRGKFGKFDIYGDFRYELAKLFHSIDGKYDFIIKDLFSLKMDEKTGEIEYYVQDRKRDYDLMKIFFSVFEAEIGEDRKKIELIEALLFLSMIPLHKESTKHQYAMLSTGLEILDRVVDIRA